MKILRISLAALPVLLLSACLEVEQHPKWVKGEYAGKRDNMASQTHFHGDRLAWAATIANRNHLQNEYGRTGPSDVASLGGAPATRPATLGMTGPAGASSGMPESSATRPSTASPASAAPAEATPKGGAAAPRP